MFATRIPSNKNLGISFHQILKNEEYHPQWLKFIRNCGKDALNVKPRSIICSEHFTLDCFKNYNNTKLLKECTVPSIAIDRLKSCKIEEPEEKYLLPRDSDSVPSQIATPIFVDSGDSTIIFDTDTPKKKFLRKTISSLVRIQGAKRKKIKLLNQQIRRQRKQISSLKYMN